MDHIKTEAEENFATAAHEVCDVAFGMPEWKRAKPSFKDEVLKPLTMKAAEKHNVDFDALWDNLTAPYGSYNK